MASDTRRRLRIAALAALAAAALAACSGDLGDLNEGINGIAADTPRETWLGRGHWRLGIGAFVENPDVKLLYRAAVHAKAGGFTHFQVVDYDESAGTSLDMIGTNDPAAPLNCLAEGAARAHCATWSADDVLATRGPKLNKSPALIDHDVSVARMQDPPPGQR